MKRTKHVFAALLAFALALSFALPAMATVDWEDFHITQQPQSLTTKYGKSVTLRVEVNVPTDVEVEYQWYYHASQWVPIANANASELYVSPGDTYERNPYYPMYNPLSENARALYCEITAYEKDADGTVISSQTLESAVAIVTTERQFLGDLVIAIAGPFMDAFRRTGYVIEASIWYFTLITPLLLLAFPLIYLGFLIYGAIESFIELF